MTTLKIGSAERGHRGPTKRTGLHVLGQQPEEAPGNGWRANIHPDDLETLLHAIEQAQTTSGFAADIRVGIPEEEPRQPA